MVPEQSVSTFVPSVAAPDQGLAVNIIYPAKPRYAEGAPVVVVVGAGMTGDGLDFSMHAAQSGFAEVRFALPGSGKPGFASGGAFDYRGPNSAAALKDIILFASGKKRDYQERLVSDLVPVKVATGNCGLVGWSNGGNLLVITLSKFADELGGIRWVAFYESPIGALFFPPSLGSAQDLILNRHYREGSCATGECLIDFRKLSWNADARKSPGAHRRIGEPEVKGILYFDDNKNGKWDETSEFGFPYAGYPGFEKQFYPPMILRAAERLKLFEVTRPIKKTPAEEKERTGRTEREEEQATKAAAATGDKEKPESGGESRGILGFGKKKPAKPAEKPVETETVVVFPPEVATLAESEKYFQERDGSGYLLELCQKMPGLLVSIFGSRVDHLQGQPDHPHIAYLYNTLLTHNMWVRLNPDPIYAGQIAGMNAGNFVDNKPKASIDASQIEPQLEPEGIIPDYAYMDAAISELADRKRAGKPDAVLSEPLVNYSNGATPAADREKDSDKDKGSKRAD